MAVTLKPIQDQTIVITGASSGIGLTTARMAAERGAKLVLAARNEEALASIAQEINARGNGAAAIHVRCDVGNEGDIRNLAQKAVERFGGFDTWINNAGVSIYGRLEEVSFDDFRRLFDTNFWGIVYGSLEAAKHLKQRGGGGGALINVGSIVSDRAIPLQGMYSASKFAVRGFTDALRMELEEEGAPVSVTLIKPAAIDTPYTKHAKNYMDEEPSFPPPVYAPETVARAILHAAAHGGREIYVGGASKMFSVAEKMMPRTMDRYMEMTMFRQQKAGRPARRDREGGLYRAGFGGQQRGAYEGHVAKTSLYTQASTHPWLTGAVLGVAGAAIAGAIAASSPTVRERTRRTVRSWW